MSRAPRSRRIGATAALGAVIGALVLTGCGAGQISQTAGQVASVGGANVDVGTVAVRDAHIEFGEDVEGGTIRAEGEDAPLAMRIVNTGTTADRLLSATSPAAESVRIDGDTDLPGGQFLLVEGEPPATATATAATTAAPDTTAGTDAPGTDGGGALNEASIVLIGLREDVRAGLTYEVVLTFEQAGAITLQVPVGGTAEPREDEPAE